MNYNEGFSPDTYTRLFYYTRLKTKPKTIIQTTAALFFQANGSKFVGAPEEPPPELEPPEPELEPPEPELEPPEPELEPPEELEPPLACAATEFVRDPKDPPDPWESEPDPLDEPPLAAAAETPLPDPPDALASWTAYCTALIPIFKL